MINTTVSADINCKGGVAFLFGVIVNETEKAVKIDYAIEPVFFGKSAGKTTVNRTAWVPKSQVKTDKHGLFFITDWFANNAMKSFFIKPYEI